MNQVSSRSIQIPLRLSRDADGQTDRQTAFQLYIVDRWTFSIVIFQKIHCATN